MKLVIELDEIYDGDPQLFRGHGHAFAPYNLVACLPISFPISYRETTKEILENIREELAASDYDPVNQELFNKYEDEIRELTEEDFIKCFKDAFYCLPKLNDKFFIDLFDDVETDSDIYDPPVFICYFHIYLE